MKKFLLVFYIISLLHSFDVFAKPNCKWSLFMKNNLESKFIVIEHSNIFETFLLPQKSFYESKEIKCWFSFDQNKTREILYVRCSPNKSEFTFENRNICYYEDKSIETHSVFKIIKADNTNLTIESAHLPK